MASPSPKTGLGLVGAGAAACAVCCAGPILGFLAAAGAATALATVVFGIVGLAVAVLLAAGLWQRRRRRGCSSDAAPTPVEMATGDRTPR